MGKRRSICGSNRNGIKEMAGRTKLYFIVNTLEYLHKGGRIGLASTLVGSLLDMKPILAFQHGQVEPFDKQRTKKRALAKMIDLTLSECPRTNDACLSVVHGENVEEANLLAEDLKNKLGISEAWVAYAPPAILVHIGPEVLGISYFTK